MSDNVSSSRVNEIIYAVNCRVPKNEIGLKSKAEEEWYNSLVNEAENQKASGNQEGLRIWTINGSNWSSKQTKS